MPTLKFIGPFATDYRRADGTIFNVKPGDVVEVDDATVADLAASPFEPVPQMEENRPVTGTTRPAQTGNPA